MDSFKVAKFMALAGHRISRTLDPGTEAQRKLGAQLLLSEVLEYVIHGLGVIPEVRGTRITDPEEVQYHADNPPETIAMLDGLSDVAYTMYWNANAFGLPLEEAYDIVCDNNLQKFVELGSWAQGKTTLAQAEWHCRQNVSWPSDVVRVDVIAYNGGLFAAGKDSRGKVRKPSHFQPVDLSKLVSGPACP